MIGKELLDLGKHIINEDLIIVRKELKAGEKIEKHNHEGHNVSFTLCKGKAIVVLNDSETHELTGPAVLNFDGLNTIQADIEEDAIIYVYLTK